MSKSPIKDCDTLIDTLGSFLKNQLAVHKKAGAIVHLDGTLMSVLNVRLLQTWGTPFKTISCIFNENKFHSLYLHSLMDTLNVEKNLKDLSKDLETLSLSRDSFDDTVAVKKRMSDLILNIEADDHNYMVLSNQCYSQWCLDFPNKNYKNLDQIHLLNQLFYSEVQQLSKHRGVQEGIINVEPSHYFSRLKSDKDFLGFSYDELEEFIHDRSTPRNSVEVQIQKRIVALPLGEYTCPKLQRPSNLLRGNPL